MRSFPGVPVKLLYRQWKQTDLTLPALSAIYRWLEQNDLDAHGRRYLLHQNIPGPTKTFEAPGVDDLWIVDFSPGPFVALAPKTITTHLCLGLLASLARSLGKRASFRRERNLDELSAHLSEHERQTLVIVVDDAQNCTHSTLEELRLLLGLNLPTQPTFALILVGDEYLLSQLQLRNHRARATNGMRNARPNETHTENRLSSRPLALP